MFTQGFEPYFYEFYISIQNIYIYMDVRGGGGAFKFILSNQRV